MIFDHVESGAEGLHEGAGHDAPDVNADEKEGVKELT